MDNSNQQDPGNERETTALTVIATGASSGVGLYATQSLVERGWHVVMACRDVQKAKKAADDSLIPADQITLTQVSRGRPDYCSAP